MKNFVLSTFSLIIVVFFLSGFARAKGSLPLLGPIIDVQTQVKDKHFDGPFDFHVNFLSHSPGQSVDMESLKVKYLEIWDVDITEKIRPYIRGNSIVIPQMNLPKGNHKIEIKIRDYQKNQSIQTLQIHVRGGESMN